jgi:hypothetical protein
MASTGIHLPGRQSPSYPEASLRTDEEKDGGNLAKAVPVETVSIDVGDHTHRKLKSRHIQLIGKFLRTTAYTHTRGNWSRHHAHRKFKVLEGRLALPCSCPLARAS